MKYFERKISVFLPLRFVNEYAIFMTTSKIWTRTLDLDPEKSGPWKTWIQKNLDPEKPGPWKIWTLKNLDPEKPGP